MKGFITSLLKERLNINIEESVDTLNINDIEDDDLYDKLIDDAEILRGEGEIGFSGAELFGVLLNTETNELMGATWLSTHGNFMFHIIISPEHRGKGYSKPLLDDLMSKYEKMKSYRGEDYKLVVNVVNDQLAKSLAKHYGLKVIEDDGKGGVIMSK
jgi:hypothetical protein